MVQGGSKGARSSQSTLQIPEGIENHSPLWLAANLTKDPKDLHLATCNDSHYWYSLEVLCLDLTTELLLMDKILHRQGWWLSPLLTRLYIHPRSSKVVSQISSINSMAFAPGVAGLRHWLKDALPSLGQRTTRLGENHRVGCWFGWFFCLNFFGGSGGRNWWIFWTPF